MGHPQSTTAGSIKTVGHAWIAWHEVDDEMSEIEPLKTGELIEPIVFEPREKLG